MDSDVMLKKSKEKFKSGLLLSAEEFKKTVSMLVDDFRNRGPFNSDISTETVQKYFRIV
jgi:dynein heavy chain